MSRPSVVIVSPALAQANNGNWHTASRWSSFIADERAVRIVSQWPDGLAPGDGLMIALHARRSAASIQAWAQQRGSGTLALVLTGTDLYGDIHRDAQARRSLELARQLVVLQSLGVDALPAAHRAKARVIFQSTPALEPLDKPHDRLVAVMVGHLREVKRPDTLFEAARLLRDRDDIRIDHIGAAQDATWAERARATARDCPAYRWLGGLSHEDTVAAIRAAHVLVHTSEMEGGAHVILEAVRSGTPVIASRVDGNVGMLGADYAGYFPLGDADALAGLLLACREGQAGDDPARALLARLRAQCALRAPLFAPEAERAAVLALVHSLEEAA